MIWASAAFAGYESIRKLLEHGHTTHIGAGIAGAVIGIVGNQVVARYKLTVGRRIGSSTLIADARHSWLDALSSAGALAGLIAVALGQPWGDPVAGLAVTAFICHVGYEVTSEVVRRLADGIDPEVIHTAEEAAGSVPGIVHAHTRARWTGRTLRIEIEGWIDPGTTAHDADKLGRKVATPSPGNFPKQAASPGPPVPRRTLKPGFRLYGLIKYQADQAADLANALLTTTLETWGRSWTPARPNTLYGPLSWTVVDAPGLANPPEKRKVGSSILPLTTRQARC